MRGRPCESWGLLAILIGSWWEGANPVPEEDGYTLVPFESDGFFWVAFRGEITLGQLARAHDTMTNHPAYTPGVDELVDFTEASIKNLSKNEIDTIHQYMVGRPDRHHCRSVLVVGSTFEYGLGRMLGLSMEFEVPVDRWICRSLREALEWLHPGRADELLATCEEKRLIASRS